MSTNIGTLRAPRGLGSALWPIVIALFAAAVLTVYVTTSDREAGRQASTVNETAANTPTELSGGLVGSIPGTAANTPTELSGGLVGSIPGTAANTPTELSGGLPAGPTSAADAPGIVATTHAALDAATGDDPSGSSDGGKGPIGFHPLP